MPMTISVTRNRKASKDFQSTGSGITLTAELDQHLLARPDELQGAISELFAEADRALDAQDRDANVTGKGRLCDTNSTQAEAHAELRKDQKPRSPTI